jgi:hypothetical protein
MKCKSQSKGADTMKDTTTSPTPIRSDEPTRQTAKEAIAANIQSLIEQLEAGQSEAMTAYLNAMNRFHSYSFGNILEIARQKPDATRVAGLYAWNQLGRKVKKGERGIRILAPIVGVRRKPEQKAENDVTKQNRPVLVGFRNAYVFDVSQTEGAELPEMRQITGDVGENRDRLLAFIERQGTELYFTEKIAPALGMSYGGRIAILSGQSKSEEFSTIVHELAHEILHKAERRTATTKVVRETEAEAIAFVISKAVGLEAGNASADYIHLYHGNTALLAESLEVIQQTSAVILAALEPPIKAEEFPTITKSTTSPRSRRYSLPNKQRSPLQRKRLSGNQRLPKGKQPRRRPQSEPLPNPGGGASNGSFVQFRRDHDSVHIQAEAQ